MAELKFGATSELHQRLWDRSTTCSATFKRQTSVGRAQLETDYVLFRGDFRVKLPFASITGCLDA